MWRAVLAGLFGLLTISLVPAALVSAAEQKPAAAKATATEKAVAAGDTGKDTKAGIDFFEKHIRPVLVSKCYECHSAESKEVKGSLLLDTRDGIRRGGDIGPAVVPGSLEDSILIEALRYYGLEMPPDEPLPEETIQRFEEWVRMGAPDPRTGKTAPVKTIDLEKARDYWAFQPVRAVPTPAVKNAAWPLSDLDRFIAAKLEEKDLSPAADAEPQVLARRICFDLTGLPPTIAQQDEFLRRAGPDGKNLTAAVEHLVDSLLASPQFGERWGRHWLDVVRYGESTGMERDATFPHAWRYRDYVIRSFNEDKPYDRFLREQVAGDLLPSRSASQKQEQFVATGFLAIGPKSLNENNREQFAMDVVDDQIDVTTRVFLGLTASCARCHDHKFDPIPQRDYYALAGIFRSTETFYGTVNTQGNRNVGRLLALAGNEVQPVGVAGDGNKNKKAATTSLDDVRKQLRQAQQRLDRAKDLLAKKPNDPKLSKAASRAEAEVERLTAEVAAARKTGKAGGKGSDDENDAPAKGELIMAVLDRSNPSDTEIRLRGEPNDLGAKVPRGFLTVLSRHSSPKIDEGSGRLALSTWLSDESNPLTARVAVNRIWGHLFGRGLVDTVDNFGENGTRPSHPELLDRLAADFMKEDWSTKKLIRSIMLSRVYRLGGHANEKAEELDPDNVLLWRASHRRLEVEAIRDAILLASGQLDLTPLESSPVARMGDGIIGQGGFARTMSAESTKRSVYLPIVRSAVPEFLRLFDFPEPSMIVGQREVTTVATQALFLMNSRFVTEQSGQLARQLLSDKALNDNERIDRLWRLTLSRRPADSERASALKFVSETSESLRDDKTGTEKAWAGLAQSLICSAEFRYVE